jgi:endonuclease III related protein
MPHTLQLAYERILAAFGPQHWWPGETPLEIVIGAVLVQNTAWKNVQRAIANLRDEGLLDVDTLVKLPVEELAEVIRPAGYFRVKARRLHNLLSFVDGQYGGSLDAMFRADLATLREQLLGVHGVGPETADAILLYAGGLPTFVVDTYAHRVLARHGWIGYEADYHEIQEHFASSLPPDAKLYNEYHALLVRVGKEYCRKTGPKCDACPLADMLPASGIVEP